MGIPDLEKQVTKNGKTIANLLAEWNKEVLGIRHAIASCSNEMGDINDAVDSIKKENKKVCKLVKQKIGSSEFEKLMDSKYQTTKLYYRKRWAYKPENLVTLPVTDFMKDWDCVPTFTSLKAIYEKRITYVRDTISEHGSTDHWDMPFEVMAVGYRADCEGSSFLRAAMAKKVKAQVYTALGLYKGGGHAYNILYQDGKIFILEATSNKFNPIEIPGCDLNKKVGDYDTYYVFSGRKVWKMKKTKNILFGKSVDGLVEE
jgi:hypothetical protein